MLLAKGASDVRMERVHALSGMRLETGDD